MDRSHKAKEPECSLSTDWDCQPREDIIFVRGSCCPQERMVCHSQSMAFRLDFSEPEGDISAMASVSRKKSFFLAYAAGVSLECSVCNCMLGACGNPLTAQGT